MISIIIATYNAGNTIERCLNSIIPQLTSQCELIIIDGASTDYTMSILKKYKAHINYLLSEKDNGIYDAWNKGIKIAQGDWIMFVGADDVLIKGAIEFYLNKINGDFIPPDTEYICAINDYVKSDGTFIKSIGGSPKWDMMRYYMVAAHVASLHNKKLLFDTVGLYNTDLKICSDYELLLRKGKNLKYIHYDKHIACMQSGGMSFSVSAIRETYIVRKIHHTIPLYLNMLIYVKTLLFYHVFKGLYS